MKKQLKLLLPELRNQKFCAQYMKREKTLYIEIYEKYIEAETREISHPIFIKNSVVRIIETITYQGELQSIMRELKLKALGI